MWKDYNLLSFPLFYATDNDYIKKWNYFLLKFKTV